MAKKRPKRGQKFGGGPDVVTPPDQPDIIPYSPGELAAMDIQSGKYGRYPPPPPPHPLEDLGMLEMHGGVPPAPPPPRPPRRQIPQIPWNRTPCGRVAESMMGEAARGQAHGEYGPPVHVPYVPPPPPPPLPPDQPDVIPYDPGQLAIQGIKSGAYGQYPPPPAIAKVTHPPRQGLPFDYTPVPRPSRPTSPRHMGGQWVGQQVGRRADAINQRFAAGEDAARAQVEAKMRAEGTWDMPETPELVRRNRLMERYGVDLAREYERSPRSLEVAMRHEEIKNQAAEDQARYQRQVSRRAKKYALPVGTPRTDEDKIDSITDWLEKRGIARTGVGGTQDRIEAHIAENPGTTELAAAEAIQNQEMDIRRTARGQETREEVVARRVADRAGRRATAQQRKDDKAFMERANRLGLSTQQLSDLDLQDTLVKLEQDRFEFEQGQVTEENALARLQSNLSFLATINTDDASKVNAFVAALGDAAASGLLMPQDLLTLLQQGFASMPPSIAQPLVDRIIAEMLPGVDIRLLDTFTGDPSAFPGWDQLGKTRTQPPVDPNAVDPDAVATPTGTQAKVLPPLDQGQPHPGNSIPGISRIPGTDKRPLVFNDGSMTISDYGPGSDEYANVALRGAKSHPTGTPGYIQDFANFEFLEIVSPTELHEFLDHMNGMRETVDMIRILAKFGRTEDAKRVAQEITFLMTDNGWSGGLDWSNILSDKQSNAIKVRNVFFDTLHLFAGGTGLTGPMPRTNRAGLGSARQSPDFFQIHDAYKEIYGGAAAVSRPQGTPPPAGAGSTVSQWPPADVRPLLTGPR